MWYQKLLEFREDSERIYFTFFIDNNIKKILAIPKSHSTNQAFYMGNSYQALDLTSPSEIKNALSTLTRQTLKNHPLTQLCSTNTIKLLE